MALKKEHDPSYVMKCKIGLDGRWLKFPDRFGNLLGYSEKELKKLTFREIFHPDDRDKIQAFGKQIKEGELREFETEASCITKSGEIVWVYVSGAVIKDDEGNAQYVLCYLHDITENKTYQQRLKESEQKFRSLFRYNPNPVYYFDLEGNFKGVNDKLVEFTGYSRKQLLGMNFESFIVEEDLERTKEYFRKAASGEPSEYETQVIVKDGQKRDIQVTKFPMYIGGEIVGVFGILQDVTEHKRKTKKLKDNEERWQRLLKNNPQPVQITREAEIIFINQAGARLYGADTPAELIGKLVYNFCVDEDIAQVKERKNKLEQGKHVPEIFEQEIKRLDGESRFVEIYSIPITYQDEPAIQTVIHDITERKQKEQVIKDSLNEKETLLKEIHHRVKNNLAVISGLLELQAMNAQDEATLNTLRDSQHRIHSIAMIHEKLYQSEALSDIGFDAYLKELIQSISQTYTAENRKIDITFDLEPASLSLEKAIPCSLIVNEVIVNCFKHAFDSDSKGQIKVSSKVDDPELSIHIRDNGKGLPEDFDIDSQQSLGMTLIQTLAQQLEGKANFYSDGQNKGTRFELRFATSE